MEDQRPGPGDLTDADSTDPAVDGAVESDAAVAIETDDAASEPDAAASDADDAAPAAPRRMRARRPRTGRRLAAVSAALFVAASAAAGAAVQPYLADRADVAVKQHLARTASRAITTLWNYTPDDIDTLPDRATVFLGGDMAAEYLQYIDGIVDLSKQQHISNTTKVVGVAVESVDGPDASVLVYTNTTATIEPQKTMPATRYMSYRVQMRRQANRWVVTRMVPVTQLSITPRG